MPGVEINSLQDMLLLRSIRDQADPLRSGIASLAQGVTRGIEQKREEAKAKRLEQEQYDLALKRQEDFKLTNKDKLDFKTVIGPKGRRTVSGTPIENKNGGKSISETVSEFNKAKQEFGVESGFIPKLTIKDGDASFSITSESPESAVSRASRIKSELEVKTSKEQNNIINEFNKPDSNLTVTDLINAGIKPTDAAKMEELRVPTINARNQVLQSYEQLQQIPQGVVNGQPTGTPIQTAVGGVVAPELSPSGRPTKLVDIDAKNRVEQASNENAVSKEVKSQQAKAGELASRGTQRASGTTNTALDEVFRFNNENMKKFGIKPGQAFGIIERLLPEQLNSYKAAAQGAGREAAATVGTQIIPAARAVRMVDIFSKSTAEVGNTVEGNAANAAASMANVWGNAISSNFDVELKDGGFAPIKTLVIDPETKLPLSEIPYPEIFNAIGRVTEDFKLKTEKHYLKKAYDKYPNILQPETLERIQNELSDDELLKRIEELRSKM